MKINILHINGFNVLQNDFYIDMTDSAKLSVLIGKNGSGKSSILEAVGLIFRSLYRGTKPSFKFVIDYELYGKKIGVQYTDDFSIRVNSNVYQLDNLEYLNNKGIHILPDNIIAYYSGSNERLKRVFNVGRNLNFPSIEPPFLYIKDEHFKLILFSLLSSNLDRHKEFLYDNFKIFDDDNFALKLKIRLFDKKIIEEISQIDESFKFHLSTLLDIQDLLTITKDNIYHAGHENTYQILEKIAHIEKNIFENELLRYCMQRAYRLRNNQFVFEFSKNDITELLYLLGTEIDLFKNLLSLSSRGILQNLDIKFIKDNEFVNHDALSEGEKQLITVIGLKELMSGENNLFLLDEPDTYLHPSWQNLLIDSLTDTNSNDKIIMTTHSAKLLGYLTYKDIYIIENGRWLRKNFFSYGRDLNWIIEYVMGDKPRTQKIIDEIENAYELMKQKKYKEAQIIVNNLAQLIGENDIKLQELQNNLFFYMD